MLKKYAFVSGSSVLLVAAPNQVASSCMKADIQAYAYIRLKNTRVERLGKIRLETPATSPQSAGHEAGEQQPATQSTLIDHWVRRSDAVMAIGSVLLLTKGDFHCAVHWTSLWVPP